MKKQLLTVFALLLLVGCKQSTPSLEYKIGQLLVAGFVGTEPSETIISAIENYNIGGVVLFDYNVSNPTSDTTFGARNITSPAQTKALTASLQKIAKECNLPPLFISIDQEGGIVNRLKPIYGFPETTSAKKLGETQDPKQTRNASIATAQNLKSLGININFTPCTDVEVNPDNPIIAFKERSFSSDVDSVTMHSKAWIEGHHNEGIITSLKHFPGHGSSVSDSHLGLVDITHTWDSSELRVYREIIADGYNDIVMVGHLFNSDIDSLYPSSLSRSTLDILRKDMHYDGVIATDDMNMGAIVEHYSLDKALELALNAGVDMIIMGNNAPTFEPNLVERTSAIILELIKSGKVSEERIDEAYKRVMKLKESIE